MKNNKLIALGTAFILAVGSIGCTASFAATETTSKTEEQKLQKPENEVIGKITAISANSVTISLAERKMPENFGQGREQGKERPELKNGQRPEFFDNNGQGFDGKQPPEPPTNENGEKPSFNFDNFFTLTGESTTIDISSATFDDFRARFKDKDDTNTTTETKAAKTYKDYAVGDYIAIELTSSTSKVAKSVRSANMMHGGFGPRGQKPDMQKSESTQ